MQSRSFHAMGTGFELFLDGAGNAAGLLFDEAESEVERLERMLSRFDPGSELSLLNAEGCRRVPPELAELVELSLDARERTGGRFDPTVHDAVVGAGYDRTFDELAPVAASTRPAACAGRIDVDRANGTVTLGEGCRIDLGGIAKGWTADRLLARLADAGPALVNAGGDLACTGRAWQVGVETPDATLSLELDRGALATSGRDRRRWRTATGETHHVVDPATGAPSRSDLLTVTVAADSAAEAEVLATALFLAEDVAQAAAEADASGIPAVLVRDDGRTFLAGSLG